MSICTAKILMVLNSEIISILLHHISILVRPSNCKQYSSGFRGPGGDIGNLDSWRLVHHSSGLRLTGPESSLDSSRCFCAPPAG